MMMIRKACLGLAALAMMASVGRAEEKTRALISQVIRVTMQDGKLVMDLHPPGDDDLGQGDVSFANIENDVTVRKTPTSVSLRLAGAGSSDAVEARVGGVGHAAMMGGDASQETLYITQTSVAGDVTTMVIFSQYSNRPGPTLAVMERKAGAMEMTNILNLNEKTFAEMWIKHPDELKKYLMPVFSQTGLVGVFGMTPEEARHLFGVKAAAAPTDPVAVAERVRDLLKKLDDDSPDVRAAARGDLEALGAAGRACLGAMDVKGLSLTVRVAIKEILTPKDTKAEPDPWLSNPDILLQCVAVDDAKVPALAKAAWEKVTGKKLDIDVAMPVKERAAAVEKMRMDALKVVAANPPATGPGRDGPVEK